MVDNRLPTDKRTIRQVTSDVNRFIVVAINKTNPFRIVFMLFTHLYEMAAVKLCPKCGKSMAANHYWYKGAWKCKAPKAGTDDSDASTGVEPAPQNQPAEPQPTALTTTPQPTSVGSEPAVQPPIQPVAVKTQPLEIEVEVVEEALPLIQSELDKINKTASRVGAQPVELSVVSRRLKEVMRNRIGLDGERESFKVNQKMVTVKLIGTTPRVQAADGTTWNFVGVITPSASGQALLKLTPGAEDNPGVRRLYKANPYYCDYCRKVRMRNETFIVQNGDQYRQVGRNCLKDFVGGANPQALLQYFEFFKDSEHLMNYINHEIGGDGGDGEGGGGGRRRTMYFTPQRVVAMTLAVVEVRGGYVSAKAENGVSTASDVRMGLWGQLGRDAPPKEVAAMKKIQQLSDSEEYKTKADQVLDWFKKLPQPTIEQNTFFQNIKIMVDDDAVGEKQIGYVVGLYAAYSRDQNAAAESKGPQLVKEWPDAWGDDPKPITEEKATVKYVRNIQGTYGSSQLIFMMLENGYGVTWMYSGKNDVKDGDQFMLTGTLNKDSYRTPATIKFVPDRKWLRSAFKSE